MRIVTIIGARPQFIKAAQVSRAIAEHNRFSAPEFLIREIIVHTGQHFDENMSELFFRELEIPKPDYHLGVNSLSHGAMTGQMLEKIEKVLQAEEPGIVLLYGDTNSTLAGAIAAAKLHLKVAHVEAGLRSFNRKMPEELNRIVADHLSTLLFCPTSTAVQNLEKEGITEGVFQTGDVMYDAFKHYQKIAEDRSRILEKLNLQGKQYCLITVHRAENTESATQLEELFNLFLSYAKDGLPFVIPLHPRSRMMMDQQMLGELSQHSRFRIIQPIGYIDMVALETSAHTIITDSGGVQKEAYFAGVPCITLREETEWVETLEGGWNQLSGLDPTRIKDAFAKRLQLTLKSRGHHYGNGKASQQIVNRLLNLNPLN
jgi:UDP-N-acetylglucosamine 2-epimerase (non-hydrolysing)/UDP-GlcNAc3NAcA epimerase